MSVTSDVSLERNAALKAAGIGLAGQLAMVFGGNMNAGIQQMYPTLGTSIAGIAGLLYPIFRHGLTTKQAAGGGALAGGGGAVLGILVSYLLGDVPLSVVAIGGGMSAVAGAIGGVIGRLFTAKTPT
jgi:hypothetical protein